MQRAARRCDGGKGNEGGHGRCVGRGGAERKLTGGRHVREATRVLQMDTTHRPDLFHLRHRDPECRAILRMDDRCEVPPKGMRSGTGVLMTVNRASGKCEESCEEM